jgi:RNA polymerase sigma-70 factor (ECF subfamily)
MKPLTADEADFASEHHELIIHFLSSRHLSEVDFYDIAALGFMRAVKKWFERPELHRYAFSTIAWRAMSCNVWSSQRTYKKHPTISLDNLLLGKDDLTLADAIPDPAMSLDDLICIRETIAEYFASRGSAKRKKIASIWDFERRACQ